MIIFATWGLISNRILFQKHYSLITIRIKEIFITRRVILEYHAPVKSVPTEKDISLIRFLNLFDGPKGYVTIREIHASRI